MNYFNVTKVCIVTKIIWFASSTVVFNEAKKGDKFT